MGQAEMGCVVFSNKHTRAHTFVSIPTALLFSELVIIKGRFTTNWTKFPLSLSMIAATMQRAEQRQRLCARVCVCARVKA